jgi:rod shape-determining protein MreC
MNSKIKTFFSIFVVVSLVITSHFFGLLKPIETKVRVVFKPVANFFYSYRLEKTLPSISLTSNSKLKTKNKKLARKLAKKKVKQTKLESLQKENNRLKKTLNFYKQENFNQVGAKIIGKDIQQVSETILINKGENSNIKQGDPIVFLDGALAGKVSQVNKSSSIVRLLYDSKARVAATLLNKERSIGMIEGGLGANIQMKYIPQNERITIGDKVITSGLSKQIPKGLAIGTVESVEKEPHRPFQKAEIDPILNLNKLDQVTVITSS